MIVITKRTFNFLDRWGAPGELALTWRGIDHDHYGYEEWWIEHAYSTTGICSLSDMYEKAKRVGIDLE